MIRPRILFDPRLIVGLMVNVVALIWVGGITPSTPAEGYRPWMNIIGIALFCLGLPTFIIGLVFYLRPSKP